MIDTINQFSVNAIMEARRTKGISQIKLSRAIGYKSNIVAAWEGNISEPLSSALLEAARYLEIADNPAIQELVKLGIVDAEAKKEPMSTTSIGNQATMNKVLLLQLFEGLSPQQQKLLLDIAQEFTASKVINE